MNRIRRLFHVYPPANWATAETPKSAEELPKAVSEARGVREWAERIVQNTSQHTTLADILSDSPPPWVVRNRTTRRTRGDGRG